MKQTVIQGLKIWILFVLFCSFFLLLGSIAFIISSPKAAISVIERLIPQEKADPIQLKGIGVLGDSQADEYRADDNRGLTYGSTTLNWVEQLQKYRKLNFGRWGSWGEPRRTGYAYNWARTGATVNSMFVTGQVAGLSGQIKRGEVNAVIMQIGANDYAPFITPDGYDAIYNNRLSDIDILRKKNHVVADITTAVDSLRSSGSVRIILVLIPDWGNHLGVRVAFPLPEPRQRVSTVITETNNELRQMAASRQIVTVDPNAFYNDVFRDSLSEIRVGNKTFTAVLPGDDPRSVFLEDGTHAGTVLNGLIANQIISAMNAAFGTSIKPFSEAEILSHAGI